VVVEKKVDSAVGELADEREVERRFGDWAQVEKKSDVVAEERVDLEERITQSQGPAGKFAGLLEVEEENGVSEDSVVEGRNSVAGHESMVRDRRLAVVLEAADT
jgi:hypothetical protein